jgi:peptidyl-prolyl cis-trans isomerase B (cyclophilin B)
MNKNLIILITFLLTLQSSVAIAENPKVKMETSKGNAILELYPDKAPKSVANFLNYVNTGAYEGTIFHRVIKNFMNQGGGFTTDYSKKKSGAPIRNEADNGLKNLRGTIAMARTNDPHSATNQFFINTKTNSFLDHTGKNQRGWGYTVFGEITSGMDVMDRMADGKTGAGGPFRQDVPQEQIIILKMSEIKQEANKPVTTTPKPPVIH